MIKLNLRQAMVKIQRVLRDNLFQRNVLSTSGSLDFNRLSKYKTSKRLFQRKADTGWKLYNFIVLVDVSGSMYKANYISAITAAKNIAKLLKHVANLEFRCFNVLEWTFTADEMIKMDPNEFRVKHFSGKVWLKKVDKTYHLRPLKTSSHWIKYNWEPDSQRKTSAFKSHGGNRELVNLIKAWKDIKRKEWTNVILIIQDWLMQMDATYLVSRWYYMCGEQCLKYSDANYREYTRKIEKDVELISFGVHTHYPEKKYSNFVYIQDADDIYGNIVLLFDRLIRW